MSATFSTPQDVLWQTIRAHPILCASSIIPLFILYCYFTHKPFAPLPIFGHLHIFALHGKPYYLRWFVEAAKYHEPIKTWKYRIPLVGEGLFTTDPAVLRYLLVTRAADFHKHGGEYASGVIDLFGNGILLSKGESWRAQRQAGQIFASAETLRYVSDVGLPRNLHGCVLGRLDEVARSGQTVDFEEIAGDLTISVFGELAFDTNAKELLEISRPFDRAIELLSQRWTSPLKMPLEPFTAAGRQGRRDVQAVRAFSRRLVRETLDQLEKEEMGEATRAHNDAYASSEAEAVGTSKLAAKGKAGGGQAAADAGKLDEDGDGVGESAAPTAAAGFGRGRFVKELLQTGHQMSEEDIADACLNILLAGRDTTANAMTWTLYYLLRHPGFLTRCTAELASLPPHTPELELAQHLPFLDACISESLRLSPPAPLELVENHSGGPVILPGSGEGIVTHNGDDVVFGAWVMARLPSIWGEDAEEFRPERWLEMSALDKGEREGAAEERNRDRDKDEKERRGRSGRGKPTAFEHPVFHAGRRSCLGQQLARLEIIGTIRAVLERYEVRPGEGWDGGERELGEGMTAPMVGGLPIRVKLRERQ